MIFYLHATTSSVSSLTRRSSYVACSQRNEARDRAELMRAFQPGGPYAQVRGMYRHFGGARSIRISGRFDPELVAALPESLRFIVHNGAGYDKRALMAYSRYCCAECPWCPGCKRAYCRECCDR